MSVAGGGFGPNADVGQELYHGLKAEDAPRTVEKLLKAYLAHRTSPDETFLALHPLREQFADHDRNHRPEMADHRELPRLRATAVNIPVAPAHRS